MCQNNTNQRKKSMTDHNQTTAMADILSKMNAVQTGDFKKDPASNGDSVGAMHDILNRLQEATGAFSQEIVTESKTKPDLGMAVHAQRTETGVSVSRYDIRAEKKTVQEGLVKTFYRVIDTRTGTTIHSDLGLFETAMGIVKHTLFTQDDHKVQRLIDLDQEYVGAMMETYGYKSRLKRLDESSIQYNVASAKHSNSRTKMQASRMKLLKAL